VRLAAATVEERIFIRTRLTNSFGEGFKRVSLDPPSKGIPKTEENARKP
jgi:hypothetical protein